MNDLCFILIYDKKNNLYTANVLVAAIESRLYHIRTYLVEISDGQIDNELLYKLNNVCKKVVVGITFMTTQIDNILRLVPKVKKALPKALLIAGGPHATGDPYGTLTKLGFDLVIYGEGEETVIELLTTIGNSDYYKICGTAFLEGDRIVIKKRDPINLDLYPPFPYWRNRFNPIEIMRGCSSACYFCQVNYLFGSPRYRSIDTIVNYSKMKLERGLKDLRFISPNAFGYGSPDGIKPVGDKLLELLQKLRRTADIYSGKIFFGTFPSEVRPDAIEEDLAKEVRKLVDNKRIIIGAQSGSSIVLKKINRKHNVEDILIATEILLRNRFEVDIDFILGFSFENDEDIRETVKLIEKLTQLGARIHLHTFIPLPGTPLFSSGFKPLKDDIKKHLARLIGQGKAYGYWLDQERLAYRVMELKNKGIIYDFYEYNKYLKIVKC